mmetsp:Transcript_27421/g.66603  ORF Transcript_27421/g.66603 Transcript_27421/m.66603 type:complete len:914 (+) Transcript_27421:89-2830(+)
MAVPTKPKDSESAPTDDETTHVSVVDESESSSDSEEELESSESDSEEEIESSESEQESDTTSVEDSIQFSLDDESVEEDHPEDPDLDQHRQLTRESKQFLATLGKYLECRSKMNTKYAEVDESKLLQKLEVSTDSGGIQLPEAKPPTFKMEYQQQSCKGIPTKTYDQLYSAAESVEPLYESLVHRLVDQVCHGRTDQVVIKFAPLKSRQRAREKSRDDYAGRKPSPGLSWLYDIVRGSIAFASAEDIAQCIDLMIKDPSIHIVKAKNRFRKPSLTGYRDLNVHIQIEAPSGFKHVCELQIHHFALLDLDHDLQSHEHYEYFRTYFSGSVETLEERLEDLKIIANGAAVDDTFLFELLRTENDDLGRLKRLADLFHYQLCEYDWALQVYNRIIEVQKSPSSHTDTVSIISTYNGMAWALMAKGKDIMAMDTFRKALNESKRLVPGKYERCKADTYNGMSIIMATRFEKLDLAMDSCQKALDIQKKTVGPEDASIARTYNNMGNITQAQGYFKTAIRWYQKALKIDDGLHLLSSSTCNNMAGLLHKQGKLEEALSYYNKALDIKLRNLGDNHLSVAQAFNNSAGVLAEMGDMKSALTYYFSSLKIKKKILGNRHLLIAQAYNNIGSVMSCCLVSRQQSETLLDEEERFQKDVSRLHKAMDLHKRALAIIRHEVGEYHLLTAKTYDYISTIWQRLCDDRKAMKINKKALKIKELSVGENHLSVAVTYASMARILQNQSRYDEAIDYFKKSLTIRIDILGPYHRSVHRTYNAMASVLREKASSLLKKAELWEKKGRLSKASSSGFTKMSGLVQLHAERASDTLKLRDVHKSYGFVIENLETSLEWDDIEVQIQDTVLPPSPPRIWRSIPRGGAPGDPGDLSPIPWIRESAELEEFTWWRNEKSPKKFVSDHKLMEQT